MRQNAKATGITADPAFSVTLAQTRPQTAQQRHRARLNCAVQTSRLQCCGQVAASTQKLDPLARRSGKTLLYSRFKVVSVTRSARDLIPESHVKNQNIRQPPAT